MRRTRSKPSRVLYLDSDWRHRRSSNRRAKAVAAVSAGWGAAWGGGAVGVWGGAGGGGGGGGGGHGGGGGGGRGGGRGGYEPPKPLKMWATIKLAKSASSSQLPASSLK